MGLYERFILPRLLDLTMQTAAITAERAALLPLASGRVLEVGAGSGLNLPFFALGIERLYALDPSLELWRLGAGRVERAPFPIQFVRASASSIPAAAETFDTVVCTFTLCSVPDPSAAVAEMRRVLRPRGRLIFIEHGASPEPRVRVWQDRLTPLWSRLGGGCHLNRKMDELILAAGFTIAQLETGYMKAAKPFGYLFKGVAERS